MYIYIHTHNRFLTLGTLHRIYAYVRNLVKAVSWPSIIMRMAVLESKWAHMQLTWGLSKLGCDHTNAVDESKLAHFLCVCVCVCVHVYVRVSANST